jgi:hypothetical protein
VNLNIGAGYSQREPGFINADLYPGPNIDVVFDACKPWPFKDNAFTETKACHVFEHLPDPNAFMDEAHRCTRDQLLLRLPHGSSDEHWGDPTHVRPYIPGSFCSFQPGYAEAVYNRQYDGAKRPWDVQYILMRINSDLSKFMRPVIRHFTFPYLPFLWGSYKELLVFMRPLKTPQQVKQFLAVKQANSVLIGSFMYECDYHNKPPSAGARMLFFGPNAKFFETLL